LTNTFRDSSWRLETVLTIEPELRRAPADERTVGVLLAIAGWSGGGVTSGLIFQATRGSVTTGPFPTARPTDAFVAVVAGSFLVGPMVVAALLHRWRQPRVVGTAAGLCLAGVAVVLPLMAVVSRLLDTPAAPVGILLFVSVWGLALPGVGRLLVLRAGRGDDPLDRLWLALGGARPDDAQRHLLASPSALGWDDPWTAFAPPASTTTVVAGPPVDPSLPPIVLPPEVWSPEVWSPDDRT
jgi:hypothetical protein